MEIILFIFILIFFFMIISLYYIYITRKSIDKKEVEDDLYTVDGYLLWTIILSFIVLFICIIVIFSFIFYRNKFSLLFNGWLLYFFILMSVVLTIGISFLLSFSSSFIKGRKDLVNEYNNILIASSIILTLNTILYISNLIYFYEYIKLKKIIY